MNAVFCVKTPGADNKTTRDGMMQLVHFFRYTGKLCQLAEDYISKIQ